MTQPSKSFVLMQIEVIVDVEKRRRRKVKEQVRKIKNHQLHPDEIDYLNSIDWF